MENQKQLVNEDIDLSMFAFADTVTSEDLEEANKEPERKEFLRPGYHRMKIGSIRNLGRNKKDESWLNLSVEVVNDDGSKASGMVMLPTNKTTFGPENKKFPYSKFKRFAGALGLKVESPADVQKALLKVAEATKKDEPFASKTIGVTLGYTRDHVQFVSKGCYQIVDPKGAPVTNDTFENTESAREWYSQTHKGARLGYLEVVDFGESKIEKK